MKLPCEYQVIYNYNMDSASHRLVLNRVFNNKKEKRSKIIDPVALGNVPVKRSTFSEVSEH